MGRVWPETAALVLAAGFIARRLRGARAAVDEYLALLRDTPLAALKMGGRRDTSVRVAFDLSWSAWTTTPAAPWPS